MHKLTQGVTPMQEMRSKVTKVDTYQILSLALVGS